MIDQTLQRLQDVFRAVLELSPDADVSRLSPETEAKWDSVAHELLVSAMENEFAVTIDLEDSLGMTSFEAARALLVQRGVK